MFLTFNSRRTNQDLARIQRTYNDARAGGSSEVLDLITQRMESEMTKYVVCKVYNFFFLYGYHNLRWCACRYLSLKASLLVPEMLQHLAKFHAMTAFWLIQVNLHTVTNEEDKQNFAPKQHISVTFPLSEAVPITLRYAK